MVEDAVDALADLLERERAALLRGDLEGLARMADRKQDLVADVRRLPMDADALSRLRQASLHNGTLLDAAAQGLRAASTRLHQLLHGADFVTYDTNGQRQTLTAPAGSLPRRA